MKTYWVVEKTFPHAITMSDNKQDNAFSDIMDAFVYRQSISSYYKNAHNKRTEYTRYIKDAIDKVKV